MSTTVGRWTLMQEERGSLLGDTILLSFFLVSLYVEVIAILHLIWTRKSVSASWCNQLMLVEAVIWLINQLQRLRKWCTFIDPISQSTKLHMNADAIWLAFSTLIVQKPHLLWVRLTKEGNAYTDLTVRSDVSQEHGSCKSWQHLINTSALIR